MVGLPEAVSAVANANCQNRNSIVIPCRRVIGADAGLSEYGGGLPRKKALLELSWGGNDGMQNWIFHAILFHGGRQGMKRPLIYLDNCCYNRPYDNQDQERIKLETEAKLYVQDLIKRKSIDFVWSFILDFENNANPFLEQKESIAEWKRLATMYVPAYDEIALNAKEIALLAMLKPKDALHVASAIHAKADYLLTTDRKMLKSKCGNMKIINPVDFVFILSEGERQ